MTHFGVIAAGARRAAMKNTEKKLLSASAVSARAAVVLEPAKITSGHELEWIDRPLKRAASVQSNFYPFQEKVVCTGDFSDAAFCSIEIEHPFLFLVK